MIRTDDRPKPAHPSAAEALFILNVCGLAITRVQASKQGVPTMNEPDQVVKDIERLALQVFGNAEKATAWLQKPMKRFAGKSPLEAAREEGNAQIIRDLLHGLDDGYLF